MKNILLIVLTLIIVSGRAHSQECQTGKGCSNFVNPYPSGTFSTSSSTWALVNGGNNMNAGNYTDFSVITGNTYEWSYCESHGGVSTAWDAQLTLYNKANTSTPLCFSTDVCGLAPWISWKATFTGTVRLLTSAFL